jgi:hypothetical protein
MYRKVEQQYKIENSPISVQDIDSIMDLSCHGRQMVFLECQGARVVGP